MHPLHGGLHFVGEHYGVAVSTRVSRNACRRNAADCPFDDVATDDRITATRHKATRYKLYRRGDTIGYFYTK